jgi:outer membrane protein assembly factor BamB
LNLQLAWQTYLPTNGTRDGIATAQVLDNEILFRMRSGMVVSVNAEDGTTRWRAQLSPPYRLGMPLGHNSRSVFAYNGVRLYALDRQTGALQWEFAPPQVPSAAPTADDEMLFLALGVSTVYAYDLPRAASAPPSPAAQEAAAPGTSVIPLPAEEAAQQKGRLPAYVWDYDLESRLEQPPLIADDLLLLAATNGTFFGNSKQTRSIKYTFKAVNGLAAPMAQYGSVAYVASQDFAVDAVDIVTGTILWTFAADRAIHRKPVATDEDLYITPEGAGLFRVDRENGTERWRNAQAVRFLAQNKWFVYALDDFGRMVILDRNRGSRLSGLDVSDFVVPIVNDRTDRIYLAANDGLVVCLHDRRFAKPFRVTTVEQKKPAAAPAGAKPPADTGAKKPAAPMGEEKMKEK